MSYEVHNATRPGRRSLLAALCAASLLLALGLAWAQVRASRALGDPIQLPGTGLVVRTPIGWVATPNDPRAFVPSLAADDRPADRRVRFIYKEEGEFIPPSAMARQWEWFEGGPRETPAHIGRLPAVQFYQPTIFYRHLGDRLQFAARLLRIACTPDGRMIAIEYRPQVEATPADFELFDAICDAVELRGTAPAREPLKSLGAVGIQLPLSDEYTVFAESNAGGPYLSLLASPDGTPTWSVDIARAWLAFDRRPADLLADFGARAWQSQAETLLPRVERWSRPDGADCALLRRPRSAERVSVSSLVIVSRGPNSTAMLVVRTDGTLARLAEAGVLSLVRELDVSGPGPFDLGAAVAAGRELSEGLKRQSPAETWLPGTSQAFYIGRVADGIVGRVRARDAVSLGRDFYRGWVVSASERLGDLRWERWHWRASEGKYELERGAADAIGPGATGRIEVERSSDDGRAVERFTHDQVGERTRIPVGDSFVPPPLEEIAEAVVAHRDRGDWLIEVTTRPGRATHARWLRPLPVRDGLLSVLVTDDFNLWGAVILLDQDGERRIDSIDGTQLKRIAPNELGAYRRIFERLMEVIRG